MERRTCAGKPDGTACAAPAMRGSDHCRHHQAVSRVKNSVSSRQVTALRFTVHLHGEQQPTPEPQADEETAAAEVFEEIFDCTQEAPEVRLRGLAQAVARQHGLTPELPELPPGSVREAFVQNIAAAIANTPAGEEVAAEVEIRFRDFAGRTAPAPPPLPALVPDPVCKAPLVEAANGNADRDLNRALALKSKPGAWPTNGDEGHVYFEGKYATVVYQPTEVVIENWGAADLRDMTLALLDQRFRAMRGDLVADVADILFLHWIANGRPNKAKITLSQLLAYRGLTVKQENASLHWRAMRDVRSIRLRDANMDAALFEWDALRITQEIFKREEPPSTEYVFVYSPGYFVGAAVSANSAYLSAYTPRVLQLQPHNYAVAKRLARYLRGEWRMNPRGYVGPGPRRYRTWRDHFADAGVDPRDQAVGKPNQFLDALDDQLLELCRQKALADWIPNLHRSDQVKANWDEAARLYHPQDRGKLRELPYHGRLEAFESLRAHLPPPPDLNENLTRYAQLQAARERQQQALAAEAEIRRTARKKRPR